MGRNFCVISIHQICKFGGISDYKCSKFRVQIYLVFDSEWRNFPKIPTNIGVIKTPFKVVLSRKFR